MKKGLIYCLICPKSKQPRYIGQTTRTLDKRLNEHQYKLDESNSHKNKWINLLKKEELVDKITIHKLGEYLVNELDEMESYWIDFFLLQDIKLTNTILKGGFGGYREYNIEKNLKISEKLKGIKKKPMSDSQKEKISKFQTGNKNRLGKIHSQETKDKISETKKGTIPHNCRKISQFDLEDNFIKEWNSSNEAANLLGISQGNIWGVATAKKRKSAGGFKWIWSDELIKI